MKAPLTVPILGGPYGQSPILVKKGQLGNRLNSSNSILSAGLGPLSISPHHVRAWWEIVFEQGLTGAPHVRQHGLPEMPL